MKRLALAADTAPLDAAWAEAEAKARERWPTNCVTLIGPGGDHKDTAAALRALTARLAEMPD